MANITYRNKLQIDISDFYYGEELNPISASSSKIVLENGDFLVELTGTSFNVNTLAGTITGFQLYSTDGTSGTPTPVLYQSGSFSTGLALSGLPDAMDEGDYSGVDYLLSQNDTITGSAYGDEIQGFGGGDSIAGGDGDDMILGDSWESDYSYGNYTDGVVAGNDTLNGGNGDDYLAGNGGADSLLGGAGKDYIDGGTGADKMAGGTDDDYYVIDSASDVVTELAGQGTRDTVEVKTSSTFTSYTLAANVENLKISSQSGYTFDEYGDYVSTSGVFTAKGNGLGNKIGLTYDQGGSEKLYGYGGHDRLSSGDGADTLDGGTGNDTMLGGWDNDTYYVDSNLDKVIESVVTNEDDIDTVVYGLTAASTASLGGVVAGLTNNIKFSGIENLTLGTTTGTVALNGIGNSVANAISGNAAANKLYGQGGNDTLIGNAGNDNLQGEAGNDLLRGGAGNDILEGGAGKDIFRFDTALSTAMAQNLDQIKNFVVADDTIQLENSIFTKFGTATTGTINSAYFKANATGLAADENDYLIYETDSGKLFYDSNGNTAGGSVQIALLGANLTLTYADFVLV